MLPQYLSFVFIINKSDTTTRSTAAAYELILLTYLQFYPPGDDGILTTIEEMWSKKKTF